jgi:hypothetical protein
VFLSLPAPRTLCCADEICFSVTHGQRLLLTTILSKWSTLLTMTLTRVDDYALPLLFCFSESFSPAPRPRHNKTRVTQTTFYRALESDADHISPPLTHSFFFPEGYARQP